MNLNATHMMSACFAYLQKSLIAYRFVQKNSCMFECSRLLFAHWPRQPMHSPSALTEHVSPNLAGFLPAVRRSTRGFFLLLRVSQRVFKGPSGHKNPQTRTRLGLHTNLDFFRWSAVGITCCDQVWPAMNINPKELSSSQSPIWWWYLYD